MRTDDLITAYFLNCKQNFCLLLKKKGNSRRAREEREKMGAGGEEKLRSKTAETFLRPDVKQEIPECGEKFFHRCKKDLFFIFLGCKRICVAGV